MITRRSKDLNTRLISGLVLIVLGVLVLIYPDMLRIVVGLGLLLAGLYIALQNAPTGGNI